MSKERKDALVSECQRVQYATAKITHKAYPRSCSQCTLGANCHFGFTNSNYPLIDPLPPYQVKNLPLPVNANEAATFKHNTLVPKLLIQIVKETDSESDCMVALESLVFGVMAFYRPSVRGTSEFLDMLTANVIRRIGDSYK